MSTEKIQTLYPEPGKSGVNIRMEKYISIREALLRQLATGVKGFGELIDLLEIELKDSFDGSIPWYVTTVKLDLEARGMIERLPKVSPQRLQLSNKTEE